AAVVEGHRARPDGKLVHWTNVFVSGHGGGTLVPFFVEWHGGSHPADDGPGGLRLQALRAETPQAQALRAVLKALDVRLAVRRAGNDAKMPREPAPKTSAAKPAVPGAVESTGALDLLRAWSPSRYSKR